MAAKRLTDEQIKSLFAVDEENPDLGLAHALEMLGETDTDIKVRIYRLSKKGAADGSYIGEYAPADFNLDMLRDEFGGGFFRVRVTKPGGVLVSNRALEIEKPKAQAGQFIAKQENNELSSRDFLTIMQGQQNQMMQMFMQMQQANTQMMVAMMQNSKSDPAAMMQAMSGQFAGVMGLIQNMMPKEKSGIMETLETISALRESGILGGGENASEPSALGVIQSALQSAGPLLALAAANANKPAVPAPAVSPPLHPARAPASPVLAAPKILEKTPTRVEPVTPKYPEAAKQVETGAPSSTEKSEKQDMLEKMFIKNALSQLADFAKVNTDTELIVDGVLEKLPDDAIEKWILPEDAPQKLAEIGGAWWAETPQLDWLGRLRQSIIDRLEFEDDPLTDGSFDGSVGENNPDALDGFDALP